MIARVSEVIWDAWPRMLGHASLTLSVAATDGQYLRASPTIAVGLPVTAAGVGLAIGIWHPDPAFSSSWLTLMLLAAASGLGAGLGLIAWGFYCVGDLLGGGQPDHLFLYDVTLTERLWWVWVPVALTYVLLFALLVLIPVAAMAMRAELTDLLRLRGATQAVVGGTTQSVVHGAAVAAWAIATSFLLRPLWSFAGGGPTVDAIELLQHRFVALGAIAAALTAGRGFLAHRLRFHQTGLGVPEASGRHRLPRPIAAALKALLLTTLVGGLLGPVSGAAALFAVLAALFLLQAFIGELVPRYEVVVRRLPILVRLAAGGAFAYLLSGPLIDPALERGEASFTPMVIALAASFTVFALLFPAPRSGNESSQ